jgi:hypothetical protein
MPVAKSYFSASQRTPHTAESEGLIILHGEGPGEPPVFSDERELLPGDRGVLEFPGHKSQFILCATGLTILRGECLVAALEALPVHFVHGEIIVAAFDEIRGDLEIENIAVIAPNRVG